MFIIINLLHLAALVLLICFLFLVGRWFLYRTALIDVVRKWAQWLEDWIHVHKHFRVPELNQNGQPNVFYGKVYLYINSLASLDDSDYTNLFSGKKSTDILLHLDDDQVVRDTFLGATVSWTNHVLVQQQHPRTRTRSFVLKIKQKDKRRILRPYLQHIHTVSDDIQQRTTKEIKLFINTLPVPPCDDGRWRATPFTHPSTFDTLVMHADLKVKIKSDLDSFLKSEHFYHKLGRVWKRSYLLYGPSGTGKSSFIAAMANYLSFDVYQVDLSRVADDSYLQLLLLQTSRKSIIVIEDLDLFCANEMPRRTAGGLSLPGLLNFMDGIVSSSCGDEKIMVFTVNHNSKEHLDSAILRPGRIDVHIHFPLCDFSSFKTLANNYLGLKDHKLFPQLEEMFLGGATLSPAEIGELLLQHRGSPTRALKSVLTALQPNSGEGTCSGGKHGRRSSESTSSPVPSGEHGVVGATWKETAPAKEFRKLYGLLRLKSSKKSGTLDADSGLMEQ